MAAMFFIIVLFVDKAYMISVFILDIHRKL